MPQHIFTLFSIYSALGVFLGEHKYVCGPTMEVIYFYHMYKSWQTFHHQKFVCSQLVLQAAVL